MRLAIVLVLCLLAGGCLEERRLNVRCAWVGDPGATPIDVRDAAQRRHLAMDVRVAGENAVRYGDSYRHRGLELSGRLSFACRDSLHAAIMRRHHVTKDDIHAAARARELWIDAALVYLPIGLLFLLVASRMTRRVLARMPPPGERWTMWVNLIWIGLAGSAIATAVAHFHAWNVEWVRLRDGHLSFRAAYLPTALYAWRVYVGALAIFALALLRAARARPLTEGARGDVNRWRRSG